MGEEGKVGRSLAGLAGAPARGAGPCAGGSVLTPAAATRRAASGPESRIEREARGNWGSGGGVGEYHDRRLPAMAVSPRWSG